MEVLECIKNRRSIRKFSDEKISYDELKELINVGICAPTAQKKEPWAFLIIQDKEELKRISDAAKEDILKNIDNMPQFKTYEKFFNDPEYNLFYEAENLIVIYGDTSTQWYKEDCSLLAENIILAAFSKSIGTCWIGFAEPILNSEIIRKEYKIPDNYKVVAPIILGHMKYTPKPPERKEPVIFSK